MKVDIVNQKTNGLLDRKEIVFSVKGAKKTPSRIELKENLAASLNSKADLVSISKVQHIYGSDLVEGTANVYNSIESLKKFEPEFLSKRGVKKENSEEKK